MRSLALIAGCASAPPLAGQCLADAVQANVVRCLVEGSERVEVVLDGGGAERRVSFRGDVAVTRLLASTEYRWRLDHRGETLDSGVVVTSDLPEHIEVDVTIEGAWPATPLLLTSPCGGAVSLALDEMGRVIWYHQWSEEVGQRLEGVKATSVDTVLGVLGRARHADLPSRVVEVDFAGSVVFEAEEWTDYEGAAHHDVARWGDWRYTLVHDPYDLGDVHYGLDAVIALGPEGGEVARWRLHDVYDPTVEAGFVGGDVSHANGLWLDASGDAVVSFRHLSTVMRIGADPARDFGAMRWTLSGDPLRDDLGGLDLEGGNFTHQHHAWQPSQDELVLFDNRADPQERSRMLSMDLEGGRATIGQTWTLPLHCDIQGSVAFVGDVPIATCALARTAYAFEPDRDEVIGSIQVACANGPQTWVARFEPMPF